MKARGGLQAAVATGMFVADAKIKKGLKLA
jgi:hypothetical protein